MSNIEKLLPSTVCLDFIPKIGINSNAERFTAVYSGSPPEYNYTCYGNCRINNNTPHTWVFVPLFTSRVTEAHSKKVSENEATTDKRHDYVTAANITHTN